MDIACIVFGAHGVSQGRSKKATKTGAAALPEGTLAPTTNGPAQGCETKIRRDEPVKNVGGVPESSDKAAAGAPKGGELDEQVEGGTGTGGGIDDADAMDDMAMLMGFSSFGSTQKR